MSSKINLFHDSWLNTVFDGRNKSYGAYELRKTNPKSTLIALLIGSLFFGSVVAIPFVKHLLQEVFKKEDTEKITKVELKSIETPKKDEPKKIIEQKAEPVKQTKSIVDVVRFVPPVIVDKQTVDTPPPTIDDLKDKKTGASDVKASNDADADLNLDGSDSNRNVDADNTDYSQIFTSVEVNPEPPGGINAFRQKVGNGVQASLSDLEESLDGSVKIRFVVMEDGSLGSFEVLEENPKGYKLADKAIQQIKKSPKWKAGVMNGRNVKVYYSFPMKIHITGE